MGSDLSSGEIVAIVVGSVIGALLILLGVGALIYVFIMGFEVREKAKQVKQQLRQREGSSSSLSQGKLLRQPQSFD
jgi:Ca2+/Na+ antiporter